MIIRAHVLGKSVINNHTWREHYYTLISCQSHHEDQDDAADDAVGEADVSFGFVGTAFYSGIAAFLATIKLFGDLNDVWLVYHF